MLNNGRYVEANDPMMNKDIVDIVKYCGENSSGNIRINTNGSLRRSVGGI